MQKQVYDDPGKHEPANYEQYIKDWIITSIDSQTLPNNSVLIMEFLKYFWLIYLQATVNNQYIKPDCYKHE